MPLYAGAVADAVDRRRLLLLSDVGARGRHRRPARERARSTSPRVWVLFVAEAARDGGVRLPAAGAERDDAAARAAGAADGRDRRRGRRLQPRARGRACARPACLIAAFGLAGAYAVDLASFVASLVAIWLLPPVRPTGAKPTVRACARSIEGLRYVRTKPALLGIFLVDTNAMIFGMPSALFPAFAEELGGGRRDGRVPLLGAVRGSARRLAALGLGQPRAAAGARRVRRGRALGRRDRALRASPTPSWLALLMLAIAGAADFISAVLRSSIMLAAHARRACAAGSRGSSSPRSPARRCSGTSRPASSRRSRASASRSSRAASLCVVGTIAIALALPALAPLRRAEGRVVTDRTRDFFARERARGRARADRRDAARGRRRRRRRRGRGVRRRGSREPRLPRADGAQRGDVRPAGARVRLPLVRHPLVPEPRLRGGGARDRRARARARADGRRSRRMRARRGARRRRGCSAPGPAGSARRSASRARTTACRSTQPPFRLVPRAAELPIRRGAADRDHARGRAARGATSPPGRGSSAGRSRV